MSKNDRPYDEKLSIIALMMQMAMKDGDKSEAELRFISGVCEMYNIHVEDISHDLMKQKDFEFSSVLLQRISDLQKIMLLMFVDKKIDEKEVNFCKEIALKMGIRPVVVSAVVEAMERNEGKPIEPRFLEEMHLSHTN